MPEPRAAVVVPRRFENLQTIGRNGLHHYDNHWAALEPSLAER